MTERCVHFLARTDANEQESTVALPALDALPHLRQGEETE